MSDEREQYVEDFKDAALARFGVSYDSDEALEWFEADLTIDQALGWINHGCGPGDALGCWTQDPDEAFASESED